MKHRLPRSALMAALPADAREPARHGFAPGFLAEQHQQILALEAEIAALKAQAAEVRPTKAARQERVDRLLEELVPSPPDQPSIKLPQPRAPMLHAAAAVRYSNGEPLNEPLMLYR